MRVLEWLLRRVIVGPPLKAWLRLEVEGAEHVPATGPVIIASNHLSFVDSMVIPLAAGRKVGFLGKAEYVTGTGVKGWLSRLWFGEFGGMIPVDRDDTRAALDSLDIAEMVEMLEQEFSVDADLEKVDDCTSPAQIKDYFRALIGTE